MTRPCSLREVRLPRAGGAGAVPEPCCGPARAGERALLPGGPTLPSAVTSRCHALLAAFAGQWNVPYQSLHSGDAALYLSSFLLEEIGCVAEGA